MSHLIDVLSHYEEFDTSCDSFPRIAERNGILTLHFNDFDVQSRMYKHAPDALVLSYTRTMMNALSFNMAPRHIGMIGLGGGSMQKYCYRTYPDAIISVAEINPEVIALRDHFFIPKDDDRFMVYCEDGADFVRRQPGHFDVLVVDGFDKKGQPPQLSSLPFYQDCYRSLTPQGLLIANLCGGHHLVARIRRSFGNQVMFADGDAESANTIVVAGKGNILAASQCADGPEKSRNHPESGEQQKPSPPDLSVSRRLTVGSGSMLGSVGRRKLPRPRQVPPVKFSI